MTDPSRIVFGISPPPHARAPIARALNQRRFSVGCLPSRVVAAEPGIYTHARFAHLLLTAPKTCPPLPCLVFSPLVVACENELIVIDQHKEMGRKKIGFTDCPSSS